MNRRAFLRSLGAAAAAATVPIPAVGGGAALNSLSGVLQGLYPPIADEGVQSLFDAIRAVAPLTTRVSPPRTYFLSPEQYNMLRDEVAL